MNREMNSGYGRFAAMIGTSMVVYPAAGLIHYTNPGIPIYVIDPGNPDVNQSRVHFINEKATTGTQKLVQLLTNL